MQEKKRMYCPYCGAKIKSEKSRFCDECGSKLDIQTEPQDTQNTNQYTQTKNNINKKKIILISILLISIAGSGIFAYIIVSDDNNINTVEKDYVIDGVKFTLPSGISVWNEGSDGVNWKNGLISYLIAPLNEDDVSEYINSDKNTDYIVIPLSDNSIGQEYIYRDGTFSWGVFSIFHKDGKTFVIKAYQNKYVNIYSNMELDNDTVKDMAKGLREVYDLNRWET